MNKSQPAERLEADGKKRPWLCTFSQLYAQLLPVEQHFNHLSLTDAASQLHLLTPLLESSTKTKPNHNCNNPWGNLIKQYSMFTAHHTKKG